MNTIAYPIANKKSLSATFILGLLCITLGAVVILGWYIKSSTLIQVLPYFAPMQFNTALGFLLSGFGLIFISYQYNTLALFISVTLVCLGFFTLLQYIFSVDLKIDNLFIEPYILTKTSHPGRMAPNTALCFLLSGVGFLGYYLFKNTKHYLFIIRLFGLLIFVLGAAALMGYLFDIESSYGWGNLTRMAVHTSFGFILISLGFLAFKPHKGLIEQKLNSIHILSFFTAAIVLILCISISEKVRVEERKIIAKENREILRLVQNNISNVAGAQYLALRRMADRWVTRGGTPYDEWQSDAYNYVLDQHGLVGVEVYDENLKLYWSEYGNNTILKKQQLIQPGLARKENYILGAIEAVKIGELGFRLGIPIHKQNRHYLLVGVFDIKSLLGNAISTQTFSSYNLAFKIGTYERVPINHPLEKNYKEWLIGKEMELFKLPLKIVLQPKSQIMSSKLSKLPDLILISGGVISLLLALLVSTMQKYLLISSKLQKNEENLELILNNTNEGIIGLDQTGKITYANHSFYTLFGIDKNGLVEYDFCQLISMKIDQTDFTSLKDQLRDLFSNRLKSINSEYKLNSNGEMMNICQFIIKPVKSVNHQLVGGVVVIRDLTVEKEAQAALDETLQALEESNRELKSFAYIASHDLKSPLKAFRAISEWLEFDLQGKLSDVDKNHFAMLYQRISRMEKLLDDLLNYSKINKGIVPSKPIQFNSIVNEAKELIDIPKEMAITYTQDTDDVTVNEMPLKQVIINLISNAVKYHDKQDGLIEISVSESPEYYMFSVKDNGPGIPEEHHQTIFEMFKKLESRDIVEGSGMGLAFVKRIVQKVGGRIELKSDVGEGSNFIISWPKN